MHSKVID